MSEAVDPRFAPPVSHVEDVSVGGDELASRWMRYWGAAIDGVILGVAGFALSRMVPMVSTLLGNSNQAQANMWAWHPGAALLGFGLLLLVNGWLLVSRGQTIGKMICGTRIVRRDGSPVGLGRLLGLRYGAGYLVQLIPYLAGIYWLIDALLIFGRSRRCLHDRIADTKVIRL